MLSNTTVSFKGVDETDIRTANDKFGIYKRTLKVIEIGTNRKPVWDFLLVFHCNLCRFEILVDHLKHPELTTCFFAVFTQSRMKPSQVTQWWKTHDPTVISFDSIPACDGQLSATKIHERLNIFKTFCLFLFISLLTVWLSGNTLASINVVALRQTRLIIIIIIIRQLIRRRNMSIKSLQGRRLVLGWVTVCGRVNHLGM